MKKIKTVSEEYYKKLHERKEALLEKLEKICKKELEYDINSGKVGDPSNASKYFDHLKYRETETVVSLYLNAQMQPVGLLETSKGTVNKSAIFSRDIIRGALLKNATGIIVAHNHPSGNLAPSNEDREFWKQLRETAQNLDLKVLDNLIISRKGVFSEGTEKETGSGILSSSKETMNL